MVEWKEYGEFIVVVVTYSYSAFPLAFYVRKADGRVRVVEENPTAEYPVILDEWEEAVPA